jgi:hypothetical protein
MKVFCFLFILISVSFAQSYDSSIDIVNDSAITAGSTYKSVRDTTISYENDSLLLVRWTHNETCEDIHQIHSAIDSIAAIEKNTYNWLDKMDSIARSYEQQFREQHNPKSAKPKKDGSGELYEPPRRRRKEIASLAIIAQ